MTFAILFTTYTWDDFVERQYRRTCEIAGGGDVYIVADESRGPLSIPDDLPTLRTSERDISSTLHIELFTGTIGRQLPLWWNLDCLTYRFFLDHQEYDYCFTLDYDALIRIDLSTIARAMERESLDLVAAPVGTNGTDWSWYKPHLDVYDATEIEGRLLCVMGLSRRAANHLVARRQEMSVQMKDGLLTFWPFCEVFVAVELRRANFRMEALSTFGSVESYDFRPIYLEEHAESLPGGSFIHPVLDRQRYLKCLVSEYHPLTDILRKRSILRAKLTTFHFTEYYPHVAHELRKRLLNRLTRFLWQPITEPT